MTDEVSKFFLTQGILGALCLILIATVVFLYREQKDLERQLRAEKDARIEDSKGYTNMALGLQGQVLTVVDKFSDAVGIAERRKAP